MIEGLTVRPVVEADTSSLEQVLEETGLFPVELLAPMIAPYFSQTDGAGDADRAIWMTAEAGGAPISLGYCEAEAMTEGTWNLLAIGVTPAHQSQGVGEAMIGYLEKSLNARAARLLLVETSSMPEFDGARDFYRRCGFAQEAQIRNFYADGEDKVVFAKPLRAPNAG